MKVILYMCITVNGLIAKEDDDTSWISEEEWNTYKEIAKRVGNIIVGHRTYDIFTKQVEFEEIKEAKFVVVANNNVQLVSDNHTVVKTPEEALKLFNNEDEVLVVGGGILNSTFIKQGLIDEIYIDIEPIIFGKGIPLFKPDDFERDLELIESRLLSKNTIQLHYKIKK